MRGLRQFVNRKLRGTYGRKAGYNHDRCRHKSLVRPARFESSIKANPRKCAQALVTDFRALWIKWLELCEHFIRKNHGNPECGLDSFIARSHSVSFRLDVLLFAQNGAGKKLPMNPNS